MNRPLPRHELLSHLWVFVMLNYLYADVFSLMDPVLLPQWLAGQVGEMTITRPLLLGAAVMMEVPIAMTVLSRVLPFRANRAANLGAGLFKTLAVAGSLSVGQPNLHYLFFAVIELSTTVAISWLDWRWVEPRASKSDGAPCDRGDGAAARRVKPRRLTTARTQTSGPG